MTLPDSMTPLVRSHALRQIRRITRGHIMACALALCAGLTATAHAQTVYRCGSSYSHSPCEGATPVDASDPRDAAQRADAQRAARTDARLAEELSSAREKADHDEYMARRSMHPPTAEPKRKGKPRTAPRPPGDLLAVGHDSPGASGKRKSRQRAPAASPGAPASPAPAPVR